MPKIVVFTYAYNAERTISRSIDSIVNQTHKDWIYYCLDNASADNTGGIIDEYAEKDSRIIALHNKINMRLPLRSQKYDQYFAFSGEFDYLATLDADDAYNPNFFNEMLEFVLKHNLDIASCRSNFVDEATGNATNEYVLERDLLIAGGGFGILFPEYFRFFCTVWGNLISCALLSKVDYDMFNSYLTVSGMSQFLDNAYMLFLLRYAPKAGVIARLLHNYYLSTNSSYNTNLDRRLSDLRRRPELLRAFLREKVGHVSDENNKYIIEMTKRGIAETEALIRTQNPPLA
jgi:glycosyltransferase involved in cell wall biosynthesis